MNQEGISGKISELCHEVCAEESGKEVILSCGVPNKQTRGDAVDQCSCPPVTVGIRQKVLCCKGRQDEKLRFQCKTDGNDHAKVGAERRDLLLVCAGGAELPEEA